MDQVRTIPKDKTLQDILNEIKHIETPQHSSEFIEINKFAMAEAGHLDEHDYKIFWDCMKVYEAYHINYFSDYLSLYKNTYGDFSVGIKAWFESPSICGYMPTAETFVHLVDLLRFFGISSYDGIDITEFEINYNNAIYLWQQANNREMERRRLKGEETIQRRIDSFFNYDNYSENIFREQEHKLLFEHPSGLSINEALELARDVPDSMYIVVLKKNDDVCCIAKTERPLSYIGSHYKKLEADSAYFVDIDSDYVDDLLISMRLFYNIGTDRIRPSVLNRKYATLKQAIFAYKRGESISRKKVLQAIQNGKMRVIDLGNGQELIDKIELQKNIYGQLNK